jgi:hypothetical protein
MIPPLHFDHEKLTKLVTRFDPEQYRVRETTSGLTGFFEDEHELEHEDESKHEEV